MRVQVPSWMKYSIQKISEIYIADSVTVHHLPILRLIMGAELAIVLRECKSQFLLENHRHWDQY